MWALILIGVLFGCLFLCLSLHSFQRRQEWRGAVRLKAWVIDVRYQEARGKGQIIEDDKSATEVTVRFSYGGREFINQKVYRGIIGTPLRGQKLPIWFKPQDGGWAPGREVRSHWGLLFGLGVLCLLLSAAFLVEGQGILTALSDFRVESPNLPGSIFFGMVGVILVTCTYGCVRGLLPHALRPILTPIRWAIKNVFGLLDPVDMICEGIVCKRGGEDNDTYYPLFSGTQDSGTVLWYSRDSVMEKKYRAGKHYTLYRDRRTGAYMLRPSGFDVIRLFFSIIVLNFLLMFILSLAVCSIGMLYGAFAGFWFVYLS